MDNVNTVEWRKFTREDWEFFSGAERFAAQPEWGIPAGEPLIAEVTVDRQPGLVICDAAGLAIHWGDRCLSLNTSTPLALGYFLPQELLSERLQTYGWKRETWVTA